MTAAHPGPTANDPALGTGRPGLPLCLFYDSATQFFCMLRKRPHRERGSFSCAGCPGS